MALDVERARTTLRLDLVYDDDGHGTIGECHLGRYARTPLFAGVQETDLLM